MGGAKLVGWRLHIYILTVCATLVCGCNKDNRDVAYCLHVYLERDFNAIEGIVYPRETERRQGRFRNYGRDRERRPGDRRNNYNYHHAMLDGPEMDGNCKQLGEVVSCFEGVLLDCDNYGDFFRYRDLLRSVKEVQRWICDDIRNRFVVLLTSLKCLEAVRQETAACNQDLPVNVWQQVLRLEKRSDEVCRPLRRQFRCLEEGQYLEECGLEAAELFHNATSLFLDRWCGTGSASGLQTSRAVVAGVSVALVAWWYTAVRWTG